MKLVLTCIVLASIQLTGCALGIGSDSRNEDAHERVANQAEFIFSCPRKNVDIKCLNTGGISYKDCAEFGVKGCDNKAVYTKVGSTWVMTSSNLK